MSEQARWPGSAKNRTVLADRLRQVRLELFGEQGLSELAHQLGIPSRTWHHYESGVTVPAEVILKFVELTSLEPHWLLSGRGPKYRWFIRPSGNLFGP
ncbi:MAG TPA: helix-turn-helix transcriptional regulator [Isosphaeraceae bacterium]|nr:helix-turn-helix transcriptional regulator [Isosphaeraceae bacterium]